MSGRAVGLFNFIPVHVCWEPSGTTGEGCLCTCSRSPKTQKREDHPGGFLRLEFKRMRAYVPCFNPFLIIHPWNDSVVPLDFTLLFLDLQILRPYSWYFLWQFDDLVQHVTPWLFVSCQLWRIQTHRKKKINKSYIMKWILKKNRVLIKMAKWTTSSILEHQIRRGQRFMLLSHEAWTWWSVNCENPVRCTSFTLSDI